MVYECFSPLREGGPQKVLLRNSAGGLECEFKAYVNFRQGIATLYPVYNRFALRNQTAKKHQVSIYLIKEKRK